MPLRKRLPRIGVPLAHKDPDVALDLQAVFAECWDRGPYPEVLAYDGEPPGDLPDDERNWCEQLLNAAGYKRPAAAPFVRR